MTELAPITVKERLPVIDILRGFAILGIILLNIYPYSFPHGFDWIYFETFSGTADKVVYWGIHFFFQGRFATMLTILLGLGTAIQMMRAQEKGQSFSMLYARRMFFLLLIGVFHDLFLWSGLILPIFGSTGFMILFFQKRKPRTLITWFILFSLIPPAAAGVRMIIERTSAPPPAETRMVDTTEKQNDEKQKKRREEKRREHDDMIHIYREGSYSDMLLHRGEGLKKTALIIIQWGWFYAGLFLLGIWVWQKRILQDIAGHLKFLKRVMWISLAVGLAGTSLSYLMRFVLKPSASRTLFTVIADILARHIGTVSFTIFLMAVIVLLARREKWERLLMPVAAVGRLAFSNYVFQTVLCTTFFYSYGFGMFGKTGPLANLFIIFIVWGIQVPLSVWWSRRFRFGPVEWLWRSLTYGKCQPMKLKESLY